MTDYSQRPQATLDFLQRKAELQISHLNQEICLLEDRKHSLEQTLEQILEEQRRREEAGGCNHMNSMTRQHFSVGFGVVPLSDLLLVS